MTMNERVKEAIKNCNYDDASDVNAVIAYAYWLGRHKATREICDEAKEIYNEQKERAEKMRYHNMAMNVLQGSVHLNYHDDYSSTYVDEFGSIETDV